MSQTQSFARFFQIGAFHMNFAIMHYLNRFREVWEGNTVGPYGEMAVSSTLARELRALNLVRKPVTVHEMAGRPWHERLQRSAVREAIR